MKLEKIKIENYKSIESLEFNIVEINKSYTYSLLGINESGKSSFLKAISLIENYEDLVYPNDYFDESESILINFHYLLGENETLELYKQLTKTYGFEKSLLDKVKIEFIEIQTSYEANPNRQKVYQEKIKFTQNIFP